MINATMLMKEWERMHLLCMLVGDTRAGRCISDDNRMRLETQHKEVMENRAQQPWSGLINDYQLTMIEQDVIACVCAPDAEPRIGWMMYELQTGAASHYPTPAFIRELFCMDEGMAAELEWLVSDSGALVKNGLVSIEQRGMFQPIKPSARIKTRLLGIQPGPSKIPGAILIKPRAKLGDLVLPPSCMRRLRELLYWCTFSQKIEHWGGRIDGGPIALFCGPSGTGKSLAAEALAAELDKPLYRVDLGMLVSKYIGETEKNINALLDAAAGDDVVLLFDEADSLFGKRGEIREARDRYANLEVSHLLARIERHSGLCILTSNLREHIDAAFARRFHVVADFPLPDIKARTSLWKLFLTAGMPVSRNVNKASIARDIVLTGGQIRNAALQAAVVAAGTGDKITNRILACAIRDELEKSGREVLPKMLGSLAVYLNKENK